MFYKKGYVNNKHTPVTEVNTYFGGLITTRVSGDFQAYNSDKDVSYVVLPGNHLKVVKGELQEGKEYTV